jgi:hypothetical protein
MRRTREEGRKSDLGRSTRVTRREEDQQRHGKRYGYDAVTC